ncbi:MAG: hypothetical protein KDK39_01570 [Leptospiraceae bacterium]|nr:hypothetical protein [Leptospiraceae bacterium]
MQDRSLKKRPSRRLLLFWIVLLIGSLAVLATCSQFQIITRSNCRTVSGLPGPEDFALSQNGNDRLIISSQERRKRDAKGEFAYQGAIYSYYLAGSNKGQVIPLEFKGRDDYPFKPHGIYLRRQGSTEFLYVINHATLQQHSIEQFRLKNDTLQFIERYRSAMLVSPNDLVTSNDGRHIYISNDRLHKGFLGMLGDLLRVGTSNVIHLDLDRNRWEVAASGLAFPNGVELDQNHLYVATTRGQSLLAFERRSDGTIGPEQFEIDVNSGLDNLLWERPGVLNVAAHPDIFAFLDHIDDPTSHSPSEAYRVYVDQSRSVERIWSDDGNLLDASSTALVTKGQLIVSQVFDPEILICQM